MMTCIADLKHATALRSFFIVWAEAKISFLNFAIIILIKILQFSTVKVFFLQTAFLRCLLPQIKCPFTSHLFL